MSATLKVKMSIDVTMTFLLLGLMAFNLTGQFVHEWMGTAMSVLIIAHFCLNRAWFTKLFHGQYTAIRTMQTTINMIILIAFAGLIISGIMLSGYVFRFLPITGGVSLAYSIHHVAAYWAFIGTSMHLGLHWNMIVGMVRRITKRNTASKYRTIALRIVVTVISGFGIYSFIRHQFGQSMLGLIDFPYFDYNQPAVMFFIEYLAVMGLFIALAHYLSLWLQKRHSQNHMA